MPSISQVKFHEAVLNKLNTISWQRGVSAYPDTKTQLVTPALFFAVGGWTRADKGTDQLHVALDCQIYVAVDRSLDCDMTPELYARDLADDLTCLVDAQTFGLEIEPSVFIGAEVDNFDPNMDDYHVWRVGFEVVLPAGKDLHDVVRAPLQQIWLGKAPDIGTGHENDYIGLLPEVRRE